MIRSCKYLKPTLLSLAGAAVLIAGLAYLALSHSSAPKPHLAGSVERGALLQDGTKRSWVSYIPATSADRPALMIVLHGSMGSGQQARAESFGYDFDRLADQNGFVVAYPQGVEGNWNDCRVTQANSAKRRHIDEAAFLRALVQHQIREHRVDPSKVYVVGVSNGGSMAICLAMLAPDLARAYAAVAASVPTAKNLAATPSGQAVSILIMNGTDDPIVPWAGGEVVLWPVLASRGTVLSTDASVAYFLGLAGLEGAPQVTHLADRDPTDGTTVEVSLWTAPDRHRVALFAVQGGGHNVPQPAMHGMRLLGRSNRDIRAADEIWNFFQGDKP